MNEIITRPVENSFAAETIFIVREACRDFVLNALDMQK